MPELSDFAVELVSLGVDAIVCIVVYQGFKHVKKTLHDVKVRHIATSNFFLKFEIHIVILFLD